MKGWWATGYLLRIRLSLYSGLNVPSLPRIHALETESLMQPNWDMGCFGRCLAHEFSTLMNALMSLKEDLTEGIHAVPTLQPPVTWPHDIPSLWSTGFKVPISNKPYIKLKPKDWGMVQVVKHLSSKHEVLNSIPSTTIKKKKKSWGNIKQSQTGGHFMKQLTICFKNLSGYTK
jgi:hypothetical protein